MRRLAPVLLAGLLALAGAVAPSAFAPTARAAGGPKIVLIVGATHAATDSYRSDMDAVYATALQYSSNVVKVYSPNATWTAVKTALQGASVVVYMGHGNGFPSPYLATLGPDRMDGFGLNAVAGQGDSNTTYYGESYIASSIKLAPNAVVILAHLCYASGNSEPGLTPPTLAIAEARIDNFAAGFLKAGARAVIADAHSDTSWYVDQLFTTHQTFDQLFRTKPWGAGNTFTFPSTRSPGYTAYSDPDTASPPADFYRSMVTLPTLRTDDVTGAAAPGDAIATVPLPVPGAAEVTGVGGVALYPDPTLTPDPATGGAPTLLPDGTRLRVLASAPGPGGGLAYRVSTLDGTRAGYVGGAGLTPRDATPPAIQSLVVAPTAFSPTSGGPVTVSAVANKVVDWSVAIVDRTGAAVATLADSGQALNATWSGRTAAGQSVPDGPYSLVATASDTWGNPAATAGAKLGVDGTPPVLSLTGVPSGPMELSPNGDGINDAARLAFVLSERATVVATVRDAAGTVVRSITMPAEAGSRSIAWDGMTTSTLAPDGPYTLELAARDAAGNASPTISVSLLVATARSNVAAAPAWISPASRGPDPRVSTLSFILGRPATVTWLVTTAAGVPVRTWYQGAALGARAYSERWNGRDDAGALVPSGRYLSQVTVADGVTSTTERTSVYSGGIRILTSDTTPASGQTVTITVVAVEALGANPSVWVTQAGVARFGYRAVKVGTSTYRVQVRLRVGRPGPVTILVSGIDSSGRAASASVSYRLH